jgi:restriction system protein
MKAWKVMAGAQSSLADICFAEGFVGVDYGLQGDLTFSLAAGEEAFRSRWREHLVGLSPDRSTQSAAVRAGQVWLLGAAVSEGDLIVTPTGVSSSFRAGIVTSDYWHEPAGPLPHRRRVRWFPSTFEAAALSAPLPRFGASICSVDGHLEDLKRLLSMNPSESPVPESESDINDRSEFATEKHLEDFLVLNWSSTEFGRTHDLYTVDGEVVGQQFRTSMGWIDILALSKDGSEFLVIELKRGLASDQVVGQTLRYMGAVSNELAQPGQRIRGAIVGAESDTRIEAALRFAPDVELYRYRVRFELERVARAADQR